MRLGRGYCEIQRRKRTHRSSLEFGDLRFESQCTKPGGGPLHPAEPHLASRTRLAHDILSAARRESDNRVARGERTVTTEHDELVGVRNLHGPDRYAVRQDLSRLWRVQHRTVEADADVVRSCVDDVCRLGEQVPNAGDLIGLGAVHEVDNLVADR